MMIFLLCIYCFVYSALKGTYIPIDVHMFVLHLLYVDPTPIMVDVAINNDRMYITVSWQVRMYYKIVIYTYIRM